MRGKRELRKPRKTTNVALTLVGVFLAAFIVTMIITFWVKGSVPDTLIQMTLGAGGLEAWCLERITVNKIKTGSNAGESDGVV